MKRILIVFCVLIASCKSTVEKSAVLKDDEGFRIDPVSTVSPCLSVDSLIEVLSQVRIEKDSIKTELFLSDLRIEKVKFYLNITLRDKSQDKFLKGWIKRAVQ